MKMRANSACARRAARVAKDRSAMRGEAAAESVRGKGGRGSRARRRRADFLPRLPHPGPLPKGEGKSWQRRVLIRGNVVWWGCCEIATFWWGGLRGILGRSCVNRGGLVGWAHIGGMAGLVARALPCGGFEPCLRRHLLSISSPFPPRLVAYRRSIRAVSAPTSSLARDPRHFVVVVGRGDVVVPGGEFGRIGER
jgi:hypothetical protein